MPHPGPRRAPHLRPAACALLLLVAGGAAAGPVRTGEQPDPARLGHRMVERSRLRQYGGYNDIWGYTTRDGREYALVGTTTGVSVVNIMDREAPYETAFFPGPTSTWRDIKTFGPFMYIVNETGGGMQIVSLDDPEHPRPIAAYLGFRTAHNLYVDEEDHTLYVAGSNVGNRGVIALWLNDPAQPGARFTWDERYAHDVHARDGRMYVAAINNARLDVVDIDMRHAGTPSAAGVIANYPAAFTHAVWPTTDGRCILTTDETAGAFTRIWNVEDPAHAVLLASYRPLDSPRSIPHNVFVEGDLAFLSYYTAGVRVLDLTDLQDPREAAYFDTRPQDDGPNFQGCWGVYPYYRNSPGLVVASDIEEGLIVLQLAPGVAAKEGRTPRPGGVQFRRHGRDAGGGAVASALEPEGARPSDVDIVDAAGRRVRQLRGVIPSEVCAAWDRRDAGGRPVAAGVYFVRHPGRVGAGTERIVVIR